MGEERLDCPDCGASLKYVPGFDYLMCLECTTAPEATGPQRSEAERPNPETDVVTVELTREEAEVLLLGDHVVDCEAELTALSDSATAKIRASLERTGK